MPWDSTELYVADLQHLKLNNPQKIAGDGESVCQPLVSPSGILQYVSYLSGWWNIFKYEDKQSHNLTSINAEVAQAQWGLGVRFYDFITNNRIVITSHANISLICCPIL